MHLFFRKASTLFLSCLLIAIILNTLAPNTDDTVVQVRTLVERGPQVEAITVGNSHNLAIEFETLGYDGYHLWRGNGDSFEAQHQMEVLLDDLPNLRLVIMAVSYFTVHTNNGALDIRDDHRQIHYTSLPTWTYIDGDFQNFVLGKGANFPLWRMVRVDHWESTARQLLSWLSGNNSLQHKEEKISTEVDNVRFILRNPSINYQACDYHDEDELLEKANDPERSRAREAMIEQVNMLTADPDVAENTYQALASMTEQLQTSGVRLVFYTPPYANIYREQYDPAYIEVMQAMMARLQQVYEVEYYDFSDDPVYTSQQQLFLDEDHLNVCGARVFSAELRQLLMKEPD